MEKFKIRAVSSNIMCVFFILQFKMEQYSIQNLVSNVVLTQLLDSDNKQETRGKTRQFREIFRMDAGD